MITPDQALCFAILGGALTLFALQLRHDLVALLVLFALVASGLVAPDAAFLGFAEPAVVTVAAVLVISRALLQSGSVDLAAQLLRPLGGRPRGQVLAQSGLVAALSAFMNNVGALALVMPVALRNAWRERYAPSRALMPLAFASLLGGLVTLIGTPPNLIVSAQRAEATGQAFGLFDFAPIGLPIALAGLAYLALVGWRLLPMDRGTPAADALAIGDYTIEATLPATARPGLTVGALEALGQGEASVVGLFHGTEARLAPSAEEEVRPGDAVLLEGEPEALRKVIAAAGLVLGDGAAPPRKLAGERVSVVETIVRPNARIAGRTPASLNLRGGFGLNVLAVARSGRRVTERMGRLTIRPADVLLIQIPEARLAEAAHTLGLLPLAERPLPLARQRHAARAALLFLAAIAAVGAGLAPAQIAFPAAAVAMVALRTLPAAEAYAAIDWPVLVLLGALFPLGAAMEATGAVALLVQTFAAHAAHWPRAAVIAGIMLLCMLLSEVLANNATVLLMGPLALGLARAMDLPLDAALMAVAMGTSCTFLTPVGHQSNTLVMEPGGYRVADYARMGWPLTLISLGVGTAAITWWYGV